MRALLLASYEKRHRLNPFGVSMHRDLKAQIRQATDRSGSDKLDFRELLKLIDKHYDKMEATITQSLTRKALTAATTPIEFIFDSVTEALLSVSDEGTIRNCNKVCSRFVHCRNTAGGKGLHPCRVPAAVQIGPRRHHYRFLRR